MMMSKQIKLIDPPSGWKYGFPKPMPIGEINVEEWLVANGYPQAEIDACGDSFYCRYVYVMDSDLEAGGQ